MTIENKKYPITTFIVAVIFIVYSMIMKFEHGYTSNKMTSVKVLGANLRYELVMFLLFLTLAISVILYFFSDDDKIVSFLKKLKHKIKSKYQELLLLLKDKKTFIKGFNRLILEIKTLYKTEKTLGVETPKKTREPFSLRRYLFVHKGRIDRSTFFLNNIVKSFILTILIAISAYSIFFAFMQESSDEAFLFVFYLIYVFWFPFTLLKDTAKRFQDIGYNGNYAYLRLIPLFDTLVCIYLIFTKGYDFPTIYGDVPNP